MRELYKAIREGLRLTQYYGQNVHYLGIGKHLSVYNATPPLWLRLKGKMRRVSVGRVEHPDDLSHSRIMFFERKTATEYDLIDGAPIFYGEDPSIATVGDEIVLFSVNVSALVKDDHYLLKTEIRRADDVMNLWECWQTISGKDNHITPVDDGIRIAVTIRPQGGEAGLGKMGYIELDRLDDLCEDTVRGARMIEMPNVADDTWMGPDELHNLYKKNQIGILLHGAFEDSIRIPHDKTYLECFAWLDRKTLKIVDIEPLAIREDFPVSDAKLPSLRNVAFGTGLVISSEPSKKYAELYAGIGDLTQAFVRIHNPKIVGLYD